VEIQNAFFGGKKTIIAIDKKTEKKIEIAVDEILVATGRSSNSDALHPEKSEIKINEKGWILVDDFLETSQPNIWAMGDATGKSMFKHSANYDSIIVYYNAILKQRRKTDYHAVPHAIFCHPEIASVGLREMEAIDKYGADKILIGECKYEDTAKGAAMDINNCFVKIIALMDDEKIIGAHIIGPQASVLIAEIVNLMYTPEGTLAPIKKGMHIHPSLNEVVERAVGNLMPVDQYHHRKMHEQGIPHQESSSEESVHDHVHRHM
jgi:mycothione reductase